MQSITDLQNTLTELQSMINGTIQPVFNDLQNTSHVFDPVISSHNQVIQVVNDMNAFLLSRIIQGLKGDQGIQGIQGDQGIQGAQGVGVQGVQGIQGDQGIQGLSGFGLSGLVGVDGDIVFNDVDLVVKWGRYAGGVNSPTITFPVRFPKNIFFIVCQVENATNSYYTVLVKSKTLLNFIARQTAGTTTSTTAFSWLAFGN